MKNQSRSHLSTSLICSICGSSFGKEKPWSCMIKSVSFMNFLVKQKLRGKKTIKTSWVQIPTSPSNSIPCVLDVRIRWATGVAFELRKRLNFKILNKIGWGLSCMIDFISDQNNEVRPCRWMVYWYWWWPDWMMNQSKSKCFAWLKCVGKWRIFQGWFWNSSGPWVVTSIFGVNFGVAFGPFFFLFII